MSDKNKITKEEFLALDTQDQLNRANKILANGKTDDISRNFDFSYTWLTERFKEKNIFYAASIKMFVLADRAQSLSDEELTELREILKDYKYFKEANIDRDIRLCSGACADEIITKSIVIDKNVNDMWNEFTNKNKFINAKDLYTSALKDFINKYI